MVYRFRWQKNTTNRRAKGQRAGDKLRTQLFLIVFKQQRIDLIDVIDFVFQTMKNQKKKSFPRRVFLWLLAILLAVCIAFGVYVNDYYHADPTAGLIFYPGGKVENTAYAPLLHDLAEDGVLNREKYEADRINLPQDTTETVIDGGCHAGFGSYGA